VRSFATCSSWSRGKPPQLFPTENNMGGDSGAKALPCTRPWRRETPTAFFNLTTTRVVTAARSSGVSPSAGEKELLDGSPCGPLDISSRPHYNTARG
jgi:hypothetical protein